MLQNWYMRHVLFWSMHRASPNENDWPTIAVVAVFAVHNYNQTIFQSDVVGGVWPGLISLQQPAQDPL